MPLNDKQILARCQTTDKPLIVPHVEEKRRMGALSYGLGHFGYDIRLGNLIKVPSRNRSRVLDPSADVNTRLEDITYKERNSSGFTLYPGDFILAHTLENLTSVPTL